MRWKKNLKYEQQYTEQEVKLHGDAVLKCFIKQYFVWFTELKSPHFVVRITKDVNIWNRGLNCM